MWPVAGKLLWALQPSRSWAWAVLSAHPVVVTQMRTGPWRAPGEVGGWSLPGGIVQWSGSRSRRCSLTSDPGGLLESLFFPLWAALGAS